MALDLRVPMDPLFAAFGVPATVTRPVPEDEPLEATGVWVSEDAMEMPGNSALRRREQIRVMAFRRSEVATIPTGTLVVAPELLGGDERTWRVDSYAGGDSEVHRVYLVPVESGS